MQVYYTVAHICSKLSTASFSLQSNSLFATEDIKPLSSELLTALTQTDSFQAAHTSPSSTISAGPTSPLSPTAMPTLTMILFTSPSSPSAAGWKRENQLQPVAIGVSVTVVILCIAAVVVAMMITFAVYR